MNAAAWRDNESILTSNRALDQSVVAEGDGNIAEQLSFSAAYAKTIKKHNLNVGIDYSNVSQIFSSVSTSFSTYSGSSEYVADVTAGDSYRANSHLALRSTAHIVSYTNIGFTPTIDLGGNWQPQRRDTIDGEIYFGSATPSYNTQRAVIDPAFVSFNCHGATLLHGGLGDSDGKQSLEGYKVSLSHSLNPLQFAFTANYEKQADQTVNFSVPATAEPPGYFPAGYLSALGSEWQMTDRCGNIPFNSSTIYFIEPIADTTRHYLNFTEMVKGSLARNVLLSLSVTQSKATLASDEYRLNNPYSQNIPGAQLISRPPLRFTGNLFFSDVGRFDILASGQFTSVNNLRRLPDYETVGIAVAHQLGAGELTASATNILHNGVALFGTDAGDYPSTLRSGQLISRTTIPLEPPQIYFSFSTKLTKK